MKTHLAARIAVGAAGGVVWAAALRLWMAGLMGEKSRVTSLTLTSLFVPCLIVGGLLGLGYALRGSRSHATRWLALAPLLFPSGLMVVPGFFGHLFRTGEGSSGIFLALFGIAGGYALGGRVRWARWVCGIVAGLGVAAMGFGAAGINPDLSLAQPQGWVYAVVGAGLTVLLCVAAALPYPPRVARITSAGADRRIPAAAERTLLP